MHRTARVLQKEFRNLNEISVRNFKKKYANEQGHKKKMNGYSCVSIPNRKRGLPSMLGSIDEKVRDFLIAIRYHGGIASSTVADKSVKNLCIGQFCAQSVFRSMGFVWRMSTTAKVRISAKGSVEI